MFKNFITNCKPNKTEFKKILPLILMLAVITASVPVFDIVPDVQAAVLQLNKTSKKIEKGKSFTLWVGTKTWNSDNKEYYLADRNTPVKWKSSNAKVATVSKKGKVTAKGTGKAVITAKAGGKKLTCKVTVARPVSKKLVKLERIKTASDSDFGPGYKITNNNDFTVSIELHYDFFGTDKSEAFGSDKKKDWYKDHWMKDYSGSFCVLAPGESVSSVLWKSEPKDHYIR